MSQSRASSGKSRQRGITGVEGHEEVYKEVSPGGSLGSVHAVS